MLPTPSPVIALTPYAATILSPFFTSIYHQPIMYPVETIQEMILFARNTQARGLIILDIAFTTRHTFQVITDIKHHFLTCHLPVLFLASNNDALIAKAIHAGIDDFLTIPIDQQAMKERIMMHALKSPRKGHLNPLTCLPGNHLIKQVMRRRKESEFALIYCDLDDFKSYNDCYGFECGDTVIQKTASLLSEIVYRHDPQNGFLGHLGGDDFIIITKPSVAEMVGKEICSTFDRIIPTYYTVEDHAHKNNHDINRQGTFRKDPVMTLSVAIIVTKNNATLPHNMGMFLAQQKGVAKKQSALQAKSAFIMEEL